jgi:hypothetical protein
MAADSVLNYNDIEDFRYNPFTGEFSPKSIGRNGNPVERRTVPNSAPYWIKLFETPEQTTPSSMRVIETVSSTELDEVSVTASPGSGQYRCTYYNELAPGILGFNRAQAGVQVDISYNGLGHTQQKITLDTRVPSSGNTTIAGNKTFSGNTILDGTIINNNVTDSNSKDTGAIITEGGIGVEKKIHAGDDITSDADINCDNLNADVATKRGTDGTLMREKVISIGDWNMDSTNIITVNHGLGSDYEKIRTIDVIIRNDLDSVRSRLGEVSDAADPSLLGGGVGEITSAFVTLIRRTAGLYDNANFDSTSYNRGWIYILYEV